MMKLKQFVCNPYHENSYLLYDETKECVIIDAGFANKEEVSELVHFLDENNLTIVHSIYTHLHADHVLGAIFLKKQFNLDPECHEGDEFIYDNTRDHVKRLLGFDIEEDFPPIGLRLKENDVVRFGNSKLRCIHVPGHSPGSLVYYSPEDSLAIVGDVLFKNSIGRTDLWGGDFDLLINGIKSKLLILPLSTQLCPGHGDFTTVEDERRYNSFLK